MLANVSSALCNPPLPCMPDLEKKLCYVTRPSSFIFTAFNVTTIIIHLPLSIFILSHGFRRCIQGQSLATADTLSHSDCFTYNMVTMKLIAVVGHIMCCYDILAKSSLSLSAGKFLSTVTWYGEIFFPVLTCVERYLAVTHPIKYMTFRKGKTLRNVSIASIWLVSFTNTCLFIMPKNIPDHFYFLNFCQLILALAVVFYCSLVVLCVLIRPGPGEQEHNRRRVDQSKQRAFYTIVTILALLVLKLGWNVQGEVLYTLGRNHNCVLLIVGVWFDLPSSLVLSVQFLLRKKKMLCSRNLLSSG